MIEKALEGLFNYYLSLSDAQLELCERIPGIQIRERIEQIKNLEIVVYSRDHEPPHFHVKTKDGSINARFLIEDGSFYNGTILKRSDQKRIDALFNDPKYKALIRRTWEKYHN